MRLREGWGTLTAVVNLEGQANLCAFPGPRIRTRGTQLLWEESHSVSCFENLDLRWRISFLRYAQEKAVQVG